MEKFKQYAESKGVAMSEILRDYIKFICSEAHTAAKAAKSLQGD